MADHIDQSPRTLDAAAATATDRRAHVRHGYAALAGLVLVDEGGRRSAPLVVRTRDLSEGGLCITSIHPLLTGRRGMVQLVRADGRHAVAGIEVRHCRYVEDQAHEVGLQFTALPVGQRPDDLVSKCGRMRLFDPLLAENIGR